MLGSCKENGRLFVFSIPLLKPPPTPAIPLLLLANVDNGTEITHSISIQSMMYDNRMRFDRCIAPVARLFADCDVPAMLGN